MSYCNSLFSNVVIISYDSYYIQLGSEMHRLNVHIDLLDSYANTTVNFDLLLLLLFQEYINDCFQANGIMISEQKQVLDIHSYILHNQTYTTTGQQQRVVVGKRIEEPNPPAE